MIVPQEKDMLFKLDIRHRESSSTPISEMTIKRSNLYIIIALGLCSSVIASYKLSQGTTLFHSMKALRQSSSLN